MRLRQRDGYGYTVLVLRGEHDTRASDARLVCSHDTLHDVWVTHAETTPRRALLEARAVWRVLTGWCQGDPAVWSDESPICEPNAVLRDVADLEGTPPAHMRNTRGLWLDAGPWSSALVPEYRAPNARSHMAQSFAARSTLAGWRSALGLP